MTQPDKTPPKRAKQSPKGMVSPSRELAPIKGRGGIPPHVPSTLSRNYVSLGCALGHTHDQLARKLEISDVTLRKHYAAELEDGARNVTLAIAANLASIAQDRNHPKAVTAAIFWLKTKGGFREAVPTVDEPLDERVTFTINIGGSGGPPRPEPKVIDA